jgi:predicted nucleic acid-binding protein
MTYALDTNIISYMLRHDRRVCEKYLEESYNGHECVIPPVSYYEIKRGLLAVNAIAKARDFDMLCLEFEVGEMNTHAWDEAARLYALQRQNGQIVEDADLFITAFCIVNGYTLVTNNTKHFVRIDGLQLSNWTE